MVKALYCRYPSVQDCELHAFFSGSVDDRPARNVYLTIPAPSLFPSLPFWSRRMQEQSAVLLHPYLPYATKAELHCFMASGFASMSSVMMASYIAIGVCLASFRFFYWFLAK